MNYSLGALKQEVRQLLRTNRPDARLVTVIYLAAVFILTSIVNLIHGLSIPDPAVLLLQVQELVEQFDVGRIGFQRLLEELWAMSGQFGGLLKGAVLFGLISSAVSWTLGYGYDGYCLDLVRRKRPGFLKLLCAFPRWGWVLLKGFLIELFLVMWAVLLGFLGVAATAALLLFGPAGKLGTLLIVLVWVLLAVWFVSILLGYSMSSFVLLDDRMDALEAISRSKAMMRGRKRHLLVLLLSFLGWLLPLWVLALLAGRLFGASPAEGFLAGGVSLSDVVTWLVTLPLAVWVRPYLNAALAKFYDMMRHTDIAYGDWEGRIAPVKKPQPKACAQSGARAPAGEPAEGETTPDRPDYE